MKVGVWLPVYGGWLRTCAGRAEADADPVRCAAVAVRAEALGYDLLYASENLLNCVHGPARDVADAWTILSWAGALTSRIGLVGAMKPGFQSPLAAARTAATLDRLTGGDRLAINIVCGWWRREAEVAAATWVDHDEKYARAEEFIGGLQALWTAGASPPPPARYLPDLVLREGESLPAAQVATSPHPPLWISGHSRSALELAVTRGDVLFLNSMPDEELRARVSEAKRLAAVHGRRLRIALSAFVVAAETNAAAETRRDGIIADRDATSIATMRAVMADSGAAVWDGLSDSQMVDSNNGFDASLVGSHAAVVERLREIARCGVDIVVCQFEDPLAGPAEFSISCLPAVARFDPGAEAPAPAETIEP